jgi:predicted DNA-binding ribbon-helix-helix protein
VIQEGGPGRRLTRTTLSNLINSIDLDRERGNLSSALRLFVLNHYQAQDRGLTGQKKFSE